MHSILEYFIQGKKSVELCEDALVITEHYVAVIDGSTSKATRTYHPTMSNGKLASETIRTAIGQLPADATCSNVCKHLTAAIAEQYLRFSADNADLLLHLENRITASAVIYSDFQKEIWMIGDCQCLVDNCLFTNEKPLENLLAERRSQELQRLLAEGYTTDFLRENDLGRALILPDIIASTKQQNISFAVIDGFSIAQEHVKRVKVADGSTVVLASDGYPTLCSSLENTEKTLAEIIQTDPLLMKLHKATKGVAAGQTSFDDRTFVKFLVG
ncbi:MAG: hypothetical protein HUK07_02565 [Bacteroidaceae bacterium]|nr:hypothetical protein [Bacteroidaceae bacterium]